MIKHLVVIFAYSFPPENVIGAARPFRFAKYLSRLGYTCLVFTAVEQVGGNDWHTEYVPDPFVANPRRGLGWHVERAVRRVLLPGELGTRWSYRAYQSARAHIRANPGAQVTILSTSPPLGSHLAGWQLARDLGLKWIADFRDPLAYLGSNEQIGRLRKGVYGWLERFLLQKADVVIANTDSALARWQEKFPFLGNRARLIWNGFDPEGRIRPLSIPPRTYKVLSHVGALYNGRNATPILESFSRLMVAGRLPAGSVLVKLIGPVAAGSLLTPEVVLRAKTQGWLELVTEQIPQREAGQIAQTSDGLLLIQPQSRVQIPGKLFEYLQIGRPILAFVQPDSPSERLLEQSGVPYRCVYPGSTPEAIDDAVAKFLNLPSTAVAASPWFEEQFNAENQTKILDTLIRSLHRLPVLGTSPQPQLPFGAGRHVSKTGNHQVRTSRKENQIWFI